MQICVVGGAFGGARQIDAAEVQDPVVGVCKLTILDGDG